MKTLKSHSFSKIENEFIENALRQLINDHYLIIQIFYNKALHSEYSHLIIHVEHKNEANELMRKHWIKKAYDEHKIFVHSFYSTQLHHKFILGHPFIEYYCKPSALVYQNEEYGDHLLINRDWKKFNKKFENYKERFYHDHDLLLSQTHQFIKDDSFVSVFLSYEKVIIHDLEYLENLYTGSSSQSKNLNERISQLIPYAPEIRSYFVKQNGKEYYLFSLFDKARKSAHEDESIYDNQFFEAIGIAEESLFGMIEIRLDQLKRQIKKSPRQIEMPLIEQVVSTDYKDKIIDKAVEIILKSINTEEIYLFHKAIYGNNIIYYMLIISHNTSNEKLKEIQYFIKSKVGKQYDFVLISHDRYWIQKHLYNYQNFFVNIIQGKNRVYSSSPYHPEPHWEFPHYSEHYDLDYYCNSVRGNAMQFLGIVRNESGNQQGLPYLFALFFLSFCRTYIFVNLSYMPNYLSFQSLWQLCLYANPDIIRHQYIFDGFLLKLIPTMEYHKVLRHKVTYLNKEVLNQMEAIVEKLMKELNSIVDEKGSLIDNTD